MGRHRCPCPWRRLRDLVSKGNTASGVWVDTAYRSNDNEALLPAGKFKCHIHQRRKPRRPMLEWIAKANTRRYKIRAHVEHLFARQKHRMGLVVRAISIARKAIKIGMANLAYTLKRFVARGANWAYLTQSRPRTAPKTGKSSKKTWPP